MCSVVLHTTIYRKKIDMNLVETIYGNILVLWKQSMERFKFNYGNYKPLMLWSAYQILRIPSQENHYSRWRYGHVINVHLKP